MPPIDGQMAVMPMGSMHQVPGGGGNMSLCTLIEYIIQRTYHELNVLSELLPRKTDMERKIEIVQFASRTRQLFVRLLALVKWASSASKVDKCTEICAFLEQQSMLFVDTADSLAKMSRETLVAARLPNFSLPCAVDVLTTGTYPRLPTCIRDKIVPPDPITASEKHQTLQRLTQVIQYRLVSTDLPLQMRKLRIENGRVVFLVEHEFEVTLTLMGDSPSIPWRLLDIEILVEAHETGDGKALVHSLQTHYIHQLVQSRLLENDRPLDDLYKVLHSFCQSLQLEVLHSQTQQLMHERLGDSIRVEDYSLGKCLVISYWRELLKRETKAHELPTVHKVSVHISSHDESKPLQISHTPPLSDEDSRKVGLAIKSDHLTIEKLLIQSVEVRTLVKLKELSRELQKYVLTRCEMRDVPPVLFVSVLPDSDTVEMLRITIHIQRGTFLVSVIKCDDPVIGDIEETLNTDRKGIGQLFVKLRCELMLLRCEKSSEIIAALCHRKLPLVNVAGHPLENLSKYRLYIKVPKQANYYVVVELNERDRKHVSLQYHLLEVLPTQADSAADDDITEENPIKAFLKAGRLTALDTFSITHGPCTKVYDFDENDFNSFSRKRKLLLGDVDEVPAKKLKAAPFYIPELTYLLACCEERLPFTFLAEELVSKGLSHQGICVAGPGICLSLTVLDLPDIPGIEPVLMKQFKKDLLSCKFTIHKKPQKSWLLEFIFCNCPVRSYDYKEQGSVHRVHFALELTSPEHVGRVVREMVSEWMSMGHLYASVKTFSDFYNAVGSNSARHTCDIRSYNYKRLVLAYGMKRNHLAMIQWKSYLKRFHISFTTYGLSSTANCHCHVVTQLEQCLNNTKSLALLLQILTDTWSPLTSMSKLNTLPIYVGTSPKQPLLCFTMLPQTPTHMRIAFRSTYVLDVHCLAGKMVSVRDGAYSLFDNSKVIDGFNPIPGLKAFLNMFLDEAVLACYSRRRSTTDDDNPPSPVGMDSIDSMFLSQQSTGSPASVLKRQDARFHSPLTPPSNLSNPHTPASPSTSKLSQGHSFISSPAAAFPLSSPPSLPPQATPSPAQFMSTPSPGNLGRSGESPGTPQLHVPSPVGFMPTPSPQSMGLHMSSPATSYMGPQGMVEGGSPYPSSSLTMPSPGARNWPGSPSIQGAGPSPASRHTAMSPGHSALHSPQTHPAKDGKVLSMPSRILPQRSWAASFPTLLSHEAFDKLLTPAPLVGAISMPGCPLERFLGCVYFRRHLQRLVQSKDTLTLMPCTEPGVIMFKVESLQFRVNLSAATLQTLHLKCTPVAEFRDKWSVEEIQILEKFFDTKVVCPPYKVNELTAFSHLLGAPYNILKDCVQIMKMELNLMPPDNSLKWSVQWCLTLPSGAYFVAPAGTPAVVLKNNKMLLMLQLTRIGLNLPAGVDPHSIVVPLLYNIGTNIISMLELHTPAAPPQTPTQAAIYATLKRFSEFHQTVNECSILPAVRELVANLVVPVS